MNEDVSMSDLATETTENAEVNSEPSVQADTEKVEQTEQVGQSQNEESFFDPNQVPEDLKPAYKQMQAAFTKKTQEIAAARKEAESLKEQAEKYKRFEPYTPILEEMLSSQNKGVQASPEMVELEKQLRDQGYDQNAIDLAKTSAQFLINQINQRDQAAKQAQELAAKEALLSQRVMEAEKLDPRLNDESLKYSTDDGETFTFGQMVAKIVGSTPNWREDPVAATKQAIKMVDTLIGNSKTEGKKELSTLASTKASKFPRTSSSPQSAVDTSQPLDFQEAAKQAKAELGY